MTLTFALVDQVSDAGGQENEDLAGFDRQSAWVFDGATAARGVSEPGPVWLVRTASPILGRHLGRSPAIDLRDAVALTLQEVAEAWRAQPGEPPVTPSASLLACRLTEGVLEYFTLGDITLVVAGPKSLLVVDDPAALYREQSYLEEEGSGFWERLQERRRSMNREGGYWIFSDDPRAAWHGFAGRVSVEAGDLVLLATDGFARLVDLFGEFPSWRALLTDATAGLDPLLKRLRQHEDADAERSRFLRAKTHDDATALLLRVRAEQG